MRVSRLMVFLREMAELCRAETQGLRCFETEEGLLAASDSKLQQL